MAAAASKRLRVKIAPVEQLPFKDAWFERAVMWLVVHLVDRPRAFAELRRVLGADGRLVIATFDPAYFDRFWLNRFFPSIERIDRARFSSAATPASRCRSYQIDGVLPNFQPPKFPPKGFSCRVDI